LKLTPQSQTYHAPWTQGLHGYITNQLGVFITIQKHTLAQVKRQHSQLLQSLKMTSISVG